MFAWDKVQWVAGRLFGADGLQALISSGCWANGDLVRLGLLSGCGVLLGERLVWVEALVWI